MAPSNRTAQINQILKILKKHFKPVKSTEDRTVLEHLLFACCLENSTYEDAQSAFALLKEQYFDWNEVRVSTVRELADVMKTLVDPEGAAIRLKQSLQSVFESVYAFELEPLTKENIGKATERLAKYPGTTPFTVAYVTQAALGGHAIPVNQGLLTAFHVLGVINDEERKHGSVPGLERTVPKSKGPEVASIMHQFGVLVGRSPQSPVVRKLLLEIDPACKERLPKRAAKTDQPPPDDRGPTDAKRGAKGMTTGVAVPTDVESDGKKAAKRPAKAKGPDAKKAEATAPSKKGARTTDRKKPLKKTKTANRRLAKSKPR